MRSTCGVCGTALALYGKHGWRHVNPADLNPHQAIIGTPVDWSKVKITPGSKIEKAEGRLVTAVAVAVAPAFQVDAPPGPAGAMMRLAQGHGWDVRAYQNEASIGLSCIRGSEVISMLWAGGFDFAIVKFPYTREVSAAEAKGLLMQDATCNDCGEQFAVHQEGCPA